MTDVGWVDLSTGGVDGRTLETDSEGDSLAAYFDAPPSQAIVPVFSDADFLQALQALMPRGRVWPREADAVQTMVLAGLAPTFARMCLAAAALVADLFPSTTVDFLAEWQESLGLPDPCVGAGATLQLEQAQVVAKLTSTGGQSVGFFVALAASLGYSISITEFTGSNAYLWRVNAPTVTESRFEVGDAGVGEALVTGGNAALECIFNELKPAHTTVEFNYS